MPAIDATLILPCYNEGEHFEASLKRIIAVLSSSGLAWEVLLIEDKSTDDTAKRIKKALKKKWPVSINAIFHSMNLGRGASVGEGLLQAKGDLTGFIDIDCEIDPKYIPSFIDKLQQGQDIVCARREYKSSISGVFRFLASKVYMLVSAIVLQTTPADTEAGYKFFRKNKIIPVVRKIHDTKWFWDTEVMILANFHGLKIVYIPTIFTRRSDKTSTVYLFSDTIDYLKKLLAFRKRLIREGYIKN